MSALGFLVLSHGPSPCPVTSHRSQETGGGLQGFLPELDSTAADMEQIVDIPARGGLQGFPPGQDSKAFSSSRLHADADEGIHGFFSHFPGPKKYGGNPPVECERCPLVSAHPS